MFQTSTTSEEPAKCVVARNGLYFDGIGLQKASTDMRIRGATVRATRHEGDDLRQKGVHHFEPVLCAAVLLDHEYADFPIFQVATKRDH